jgi:hypothetical protein
MIRGLFIASVLLSIVSWYTTFEGMTLYLSRWFALLASVGVQTAMLFTAWLLTRHRHRRNQILAVYAITAVVSVAFSYVSLYSWFAQRERPAMVQRELFDRLAQAAQQTDETLSAAEAEARKHVIALTEMTEAEKRVGFLAKAVDADPYLSNVREAVAREAQGREGAGEGVRYSAFARYTRIAEQTQAQMQSARQAIAQWRQRAKASDSSVEQLRAYQQATSGIPWNSVAETLHTNSFERPAVPTLAEFTDRTGSGQEDLLLAFTELFASPTARHSLSFALALSFDLIIILIALVSAGAPETQWAAAAAALDAIDGQVFARDLLRKVQAGPDGLGRIPGAGLSAGETQLLLLLVHRGLATPAGDDFLLDPGYHASLVESLSLRGVPLRAQRAAAG